MKIPKKIILLFLCFSFSLFYTSCSTKKDSQLKEELTSIVGDLDENKTYVYLSASSCTGCKSNYIQQLIEDEDETMVYILTKSLGQSIVSSYQLDHRLENDIFLGDLDVNISPAYIRFEQGTWKVNEN